MRWEWRGWKRVRRREWNREDGAETVVMGVETVVVLLGIEEAPSLHGSSIHKELTPHSLGPRAENNVRASFP